MVISAQVIEKEVTGKPSSLRQRLVNKVQQTKPFGESITKVT